MKKGVAVSLAALLIALVLRQQPVESHLVVATTVTFDREISRIVKKRCISCHSDNNIGMPLTAYEGVRPWSKATHDGALRRPMPPWRAIAGYGEFANDASLTSREMQFLTAWVDGGGPKGKEQIVVNVDILQTPENERLKGDFDRWQLGKPDV